MSRSVHTPRSCAPLWRPFALVAAGLLAMACAQEPAPAVTGDPAALHQQMLQEWQAQKDAAPGGLDHAHPSDELVARARAVIELDPAQARYHATLVDLLWAKHAYADLIEAADAGLVHAPGHAPLVLMKGESQALLGRHEAAQVTLDTGYQAALLAGDLEGAFELQAALGGVHLALQDREQALQHFEQAVEGMEAASASGTAMILDSCPYLALGKMYRDDGREDEALAVMRRGLELAPQNAQVVAATYQQALRTEEFDEAAGVLLAHPDIMDRRLMPTTFPWHGEVHPQGTPPDSALFEPDREAVFRAALLAQQRGDSARSRKVLATNLHGEPHPRALVLRVMHLLEDGEIEAAVVLAEANLLAAPDDPGTRLAMGHAHIAQRDPQAAAALIAPLVTAAEPADPYQAYLARLARLGLAWCHSARGEHQRALVLFDAQLQHAPEDQAALLGSADALLALGRADEAAERATAAHAHAPGTATAVGMGMVAARQGRDADAEAAFLEALDDAGDFACPYEGLGLLYLQQGRADDAVPLLEAALEQAPDPERAQALREALEAVKSEP